METELKMNLIKPIFDYVSRDVYKLPHTLSVDYLGRRLRYLYYYYYIQKMPILSERQLGGGVFVLNNNGSAVPSRRKNSVFRKYPV